MNELYNYNKKKIIILILPNEDKCHILVLVLKSIRQN